MSLHAPDPTQVQYVVGDATDQTPADGPKIIAHVCNDIGRWGRGFVVAVSQRWPEPEYWYRKAWADRVGRTLPLGTIQLAHVRGGEPWDMWVANMIAQRGLRSSRNPVPIRYDALRTCLYEVAMRARPTGASVHMPRIGCGLAGGTWDCVEPLIRETLCAAAVPVTVYDLPGSPPAEHGKQGDRMRR